MIRSSFINSTSHKMSKLLDGLWKKSPLPCSLHISTLLSWCGLRTLWLQIWHHCYFPHILFLLHTWLCLFWRNWIRAMFSDLLSLVKINISVKHNNYIFFFHLKHVIWNIIPMEYLSFNIQIFKVSLFCVSKLLMLKLGGFEISFSSLFVPFLYAA